MRLVCWSTTLRRMDGELEFLDSSVHLGSRKIMAEPEFKINALSRTLSYLHLV
jgi:hypothetical protein